MKKLICFSFLICLIQVAIYSEDNTLADNYIKYFRRGNIDTKIQVIKNAANTKDANMGPLFHEAVGFITQNTTNLKILKNNPAIGEMVILSIQKIGEIPYKEARYTLWKLYQKDETTIIRINILNTFSTIAKGDKNIINGLNKWLYKQNNRFLTQDKPEFQIVDACLRTLGALKDPSSFPDIFRSMNLQYSVMISETALESLYLIKGKMKDHLLNIIENRPVQDKYDALAFSLDVPKLTDDERKEIIKYSLNITLETETIVQQDLNIFKEIGYLAIRSAAIFKMREASDLAIRHFNKISKEYRDSKATKPHLIEAIDCLGSIATKEAAKTLTNHLHSLNQYTEQTRVYDEQVVITLINNLIKIGDPVGLDPIQYAVFLGYSDRIKNVAKDAVKTLLK